MPTPVSIPAALRAAEPIWFADHQDPDGSFFNPWRRSPIKKPAELWRWKTGTNPFAAAKRGRADLPVFVDPLGAFGSLPEPLRVMWLGHASVYIQLDGVGLLVDPVFGRAGGLIPRQAAAPVAVERLPPVDAVVLSHGHMDHLDGSSLAALAGRFGAGLPFIVPRGLALALPAACRNRIELDWWQSTPVGGVEVALVPAHHWHRRGLNDTNRALWAGVVARGSRTVYHSGDTGWFDGFRAIGRVFEGIDVAVLPIGAYEPRWFMGEQHIAPEDVLRAFDDLGAATFLAMHWGTFDLTDEPLDHGARAMLPALIAERGLNPARFAVVAHGGSVGVGDSGTAVVGRLP